jgi:hypothetical protein
MVICTGCAYASVAMMVRMARARVDGGRALVHGFVTCGWQGGLL